MNKLNQLTRTTQMIQSNQSINNILLTFLENLRFRWPFFQHFSNRLNWFNQTSHSKSIDSITYFMKTNWLYHQSTHLEKELNQFNQFCKKWIDSNQSTQWSWLVYTIIKLLSITYKDKNNLSMQIMQRNKTSRHENVELNGCPHSDYRVCSVSQMVDS